MRKQMRKKMKLTKVSVNGESFYILGIADEQDIFYEVQSRYGSGVEFDSYIYLENTYFIDNLEFIKHAELTRSVEIER